MPLAETISNLFRQKTESPHPRKVWDYDQFRDYLLLISRGPEFTFPYDQYPERIRVSKPWHELLNQMRETSMDGKERQALIGYKNGSSSLYLPRITATGDNKAVPGEIILAEKKKASWAGISVIGDIHSHPNAFRNSAKTNRSFSSADLYNLLVPDYFIRVMCLAETDRNLLAFRARDTEMLLSTLTLTQEQFSEYWIEQKLNVWDTSMAITQRHKLAIYSGKPNGELERKTALLLSRP